MVAEQTNLDVDASDEERREARMPRISNRIDHKRYGDSRDDADRSSMLSSTSRQQALLHSNKVPFCRSSPASAVSSETLESLIALGNELKKVRRRLITEGYVIDGTRIYKPSENDFEN